MKPPNLSIMRNLNGITISLILFLNTALQAAPFEFPDTAVYHYNVTYNGTWGPAGAELPWLQAQMNFNPRVVDYPCCPVILLSTRLAQGSTGDLKGLTQSPPGTISLYAPIVRMGVRLQGNGPVYLSQSTDYGVIKTVTLTQSSPPATASSSLWHWLQFSFDSAFNVNPAVSNYNRASNSAPSTPTNYGPSENLKEKGYYLVDGQLRFPAPINDLRTRYDQSQGSLFRLIMDESWMSHYDIVILSQKDGHYSGAAIPHLRITNGRPNSFVRFHFLALYEPYYNKDATLVSNTRFLFVQKAWGSLSSRKGQICLHAECIQGDSEKEEKEEPKRRPDPRKKPPIEVKPGKDKPVILDRIRKENEMQAVQRDRLFKPEIKLPGSWKPLAPARVAVRLIAAPGSDLNGVSLQFSAYRKSDNRLTRATLQREKYSPVDARYHQSKFDPPINQIHPAPLDEERYYLNIDDSPGTEYGFSCSVIYRTTGHNCSAGNPNETIVSVTLITSVDGRNPKRKEFRRFEDAFAAYRVAQAYSAQKYLPDEDSYLLFEIQFKKPE